MASDELYKLAVEFDKKKLWNKLDSDQIFGLKLADGRIIYCSVRGKYGEENYALAVYVDTEGLNSLRHSEIGFGKIADNEIFLLDVSQNCLQVIFEVKDALSEEELKAERAFTRRNKIYFRKKYSHPRFLKFTPLCLATQIKNLEDEKILSQAILAAIEVAKKFPEKLPRKITFSADVPIRRKFPLLTFDGENYKWTMQNFPPFRRVNYPEANLNPKNLKKLSVAKKSGSYCCDIFILPLAVKDDDGKKKFSVTLMTYDKTKKRVIEIEPATNYIDAPENLTLSVAKAFIKNGVPKKIFVRNERSYIFLEKFSIFAMICIIFV